MSTRGRKPELKVIEGGAGMDDEPDTIPSHIPSDMHDEWRAVVSDLQRRKMLTEAVLGVVETYIMAKWNARKAQEALDLHGPLIDGGKGILKVNPATGLLGKANSAALRLSAELGLTPASRSKKTMGGGEDPDADDTFGQRSLFDV